uniref:hypothetical protein n=1 Tax=Methylobacterium sp. TaxID=409 RepID=UPI003B01A746
GRHAQLREETQNAADATAVGGAGYVARSFNTVAMNNVEISRLIAAVQVLDSIPLAAEYTVADLEATLTTVENQLARGTAGIPHLREFMLEIQEDLVWQLVQLEEMDELFNHSGYDVRDMTYYSHPEGGERGELWKAMESLSALSQATMENVGELSQVSAIQAGKDNMHHQGDEAAAFIAPFEPAYAWRAYSFNDFRQPVVRGRIPDWADDEVTNRGPYDTIFGWHRYGEDEDPLGGGGGDTIAGPIERDGFGSRFSSRRGRGNQGPRRPRIITIYDTYGTLSWALDLIDNTIDRPGTLYNSQFDHRVQLMSAQKINNLWPGSARGGRLFDPQWITDYAQAESIVEAGTPEPKYNRWLQFIELRTETEYPRDGTLLRAIGQRDRVESTEIELVDWDIVRTPGRLLTIPGAEKIGNHIWEDEASETWVETEVREIRNDLPDRDQVIASLENNGAYTVRVFPGGRATVRFDVRVTYFDTNHFTWLGLNVGPEITPRNPNPGGPPADIFPIDFDHALMFRPQDGAVGRPGEPFAILGVAKQPSTAPMWPRLFRPEAYDGHVAIAQAGVFNNHSWDLWTQMWHAQLEPVQDFAGWVDVMENGRGQANGLPDLSPGEVDGVTEYLRSVEGLAPVLLNH